MQAADVIVQASDNEPFGMVIIEAMALGKPVIATASAGPREIITDEVDGLLVPFANPNSMAAALMRCLTDEEFREKIARGARTASRRFSVRAYSDSFSHAVSELAG